MDDVVADAQWVKVFPSSKEGGSAQGELQSHYQAVAVVGAADLRLVSGQEVAEVGDDDSAQVTQQIGRFVAGDGRYAIEPVRRIATQAKSKVDAKSRLTVGCFVRRTEDRGG